MSEVKEVLKEVEALSEKIGGFGNLIEEQRKTLEAQAEEVAKFGESSASTTEKLAKMEKQIGEFDDLNDKLAQAVKAQEAADEEAKKRAEQLDRIEIAIKRSGKAGGTEADEKAAEHKDAFNAYCRFGLEGCTPEQAKILRDRKSEEKALSVGDSTQAGYLAPTESVNEIIKAVTEVSPVRTAARVRQTANRAIMIPKRTGQFAAVWVAERGTRSETEGLTYGMEEIPVHEHYALVDISEQMLEDSGFNLESELNTEFTEQFAVGEGAAFVNGTSSGQPEGFLTNADLGSTNSGSAATIADANGQANGIIDLYHGIKTAYAVRGTWMLNRSTLGAVRKLKDGQNQYVWQAGLANLRPNTILDAPYVEVPDMPDEGAGTFPIAFGDWSRAYTIVDRIQLAVLRDPFTQATAGNVRFIARRRVGGQVVLAEAIRKLQCAA